MPSEGPIDPTDIPGRVIHHASMHCQRCLAEGVPPSSQLTLTRHEWAAQQSRKCLNCGRWLHGQYELHAYGSVAKLLDQLVNLHYFVHDVQVHEDANGYTGTTVNLHSAANLQSELSLVKLHWFWERTKDPLVPRELPDMVVESLPTVVRGLVDWLKNRLVLTHGDLAGQRKTLRFNLKEQVDQCSLQSVELELEWESLLTADGWHAASGADKRDSKGRPLVAKSIPETAVPTASPQQSRGGFRLSTLLYKLGL